MSLIGRLRRRVQARRYHDLVAGSSLFDAPWYLRRYADVARSRLDPATHYLRFGAPEGRDPGPGFSTNDYRARNPDVDASGLNPLVHHLLRSAETGPAGAPEPRPGSIGSNELASPRLQAAGRGFDSTLEPPLVDDIQAGSLRWAYRGVACQKNPFDLAHYTTLIGRLRPATVLEIGTFRGGSALWFADMLAAHRIAGARVVTVDVAPAVVEHDPRVTYLTGSARDLDAVLPAAMLARLRRPWLVIDDASHMEPDVAGVLAWIHPRLEAGDYLVVEDGLLSQFSDPIYDHYADGPNRAVAAFLAEHAGEYEIDVELCDWFGHNVTWNPNAWLRRM